MVDENEAETTERFGLSAALLHGEAPRLRLPTQVRALDRAVPSVGRTGLERPVR